MNNPTGETLEQRRARTEKARQTLINRTDARIAARLRDHGWTVTPPEDAKPTTNEA